VHHPEPYTLAHNSNFLVGRWLEALDCRLRGRPVLSSWRLQR